MPYWCTKFEGKRSMGRLFWLKVIVLNQCEEEEKYEENQAIFRIVYLYNYQDWNKDWNLAFEPW